MSRQGFGGLLADGQWARFLKAGRTRWYGEDDLIIRQGERKDMVFLLVEGMVKITMVRHDGADVLLTLRGPGESLGEMSALSGLPHSATVTAAGGDCLVRMLTSAQFRLLVKDMDLEGALWEHLVLRQSESDSLRAEMAALPTKQRLAAALLRFASLTGAGNRARVEGGSQGKKGVLLRFGLSQKELGDSIGLSRASVAGEYNRLRALGIIRTGREYVAIHDMDRLRGLAEGAD